MCACVWRERERERDRERETDRPYIDMFFCLIQGLHLAVFRDESGQVHAIDAYCPHLGANLAVGGKVTGSCLSCPFHGWRFRGEDGKCVHIPYSETGKLNLNTKMIS